MRKFVLFLICLWKADNVLSSSSTVVSANSTDPAPSPSSANLLSTPSSNDSFVQVSTVILDLSTSVFDSPSNNTIQPTATSDLQSLQTVGENPPTKVVPDIDCADINWKNPTSACSDADCIKKQMITLAKMSSCLEETRENVSFSRMDIPKQVISMGLNFAKAIKRKLDSGELEVINATAVVVTEDMAMEVGVIDSADYNETKIKSFPIYKDLLTGKWANMDDSVIIPVGELPSTGKSIYAVALMLNLLNNKYLRTAEMDWTENYAAVSEISELYVTGDVLLTHKKMPKKAINSNIFSVAFQHERTELKGPLNKPALLRLKQLQTNKEHFDTICVSLDGGLWSRDGSNVKETRGSRTTCEISHLSTFALISKVTEKVDDSARKMVVTVASVLGSFSILGLLICAIVAIVTNYHQRDNMRIALNIDVSLLLSQLVFFIGLSTNDNMFFSSPKTCEVVNPFVHLFELAALTWLLMEALYYYSTLRPLFNENNTVPIVFYFTVGWGLPIAFASACAEFNYPHFGSPERSEFCWMFVRGGDAWFFGAPVLILVLLNLITRAFILKEVINWEDDPDDIRLERIKTRLVTSLVLMLVIVLTWLSGIFAVNNTENKTYHYVFIVFYTFQGLLVLLFYCIRNQEMWEFRKGKKEEEEKEKNKTYDFVYHP